MKIRDVDQDSNKALTESVEHSNGKFSGFIPGSKASAWELIKDNIKQKTGQSINGA